MTLLRFTHDSYLTKILSVLRFYWTKLHYRGVFRTNGISLIGRMCDVIIRPGGSVEFGDRVILSGANQIYASGSMTLGSNITINEYSRIVAFEEVVIGSNVTIAKFVTIVDHNHAYTMNDGQMVLDGYETAPIRIGSNVLVGDKVTILKGVVIGDNVVIASNSVVNRDIPGNSVVGGVPARRLKSLAN